MRTDRGGYPFARPSFLEGAARIVDFGNVLNRYDFSQLDAGDAQSALKRDWEAVGNDLWRAMGSNTKGKDTGRRG